MDFTIVVDSVFSQVGPSFEIVTTKILVDDEFVDSAKAYIRSTFPKGTPVRCIKGGYEIVTRTAKANPSYVPPSPRTANSSSGMDTFTKAKWEEDEREPTKKGKKR
jgi:hypothetical protein